MTPVLLSEAVVQLVGLLKAGMVFVSLHIELTTGLELEAMVVLELVHLVAPEVVQVALEVVVLVEPVVVVVSFLSNLILLRTESSSPVDMRPVLPGESLLLVALMLLSTISLMLLAGIGLSPAAAILFSPPLFSI